MSEVKYTTVLCADYTCRFCSGGGYYGICKHPANADKAVYGGIDRYYMNSCKLKEFEKPKNNASHISINGIDITEFLIGNENE